MALLTPQELTDGLRSLPSWKQDGKTIQRNWTFPDFAGAMKFVNQVAELAEKANHHPDIDIRYNQVKLALTSHDSGGVTKRDLRLAAQIDQVR